MNSRVRIAIFVISLTIEVSCFQYTHASTKQVLNQFGNGGNIFSNKTLTSEDIKSVGYVLKERLSGSKLESDLINSVVVTQTLKYDDNSDNFADVELVSHCGGKRFSKNIELKFKFKPEANITFNVVTYSEAERDLKEKCCFYERKSFVFTQFDDQFEKIEVFLNSSVLEATGYIYKVHLSYHIYDAITKIMVLDSNPGSDSLSYADVNIVEGGLLQNNVELQFKPAGKEFLYHLIINYMNVPLPLVS